jgi:type IV fimbrial biogenesis protein FimT
MSVQHIPQRHTSRSGFTLLELLAAIALLGVVAVIGIPNLQRLVLDNRISTASAQLAFSLYRARSEAIKRNQTVVACASRDNLACDTPGQWRSGWMLFVDSDGDSTRAAGEALLLHDSIPPAINVRSSRSTPIAFRFDGRSPGANTTFTLCDPAGIATARQITLSNSGRVRLGTATSSVSCELE